jgi:ABC-type Mn2+/Zn2+ transport system permease subunit
VGAVLAISVLVSLVSLGLGLVIAMKVQVLSTGPVIVLLQSLIFLVSRVVARRP